MYIGEEHSMGEEEVRSWYVEMKDESGKYHFATVYFSKLH